MWLLFCKGELINKVIYVDNSIHSHITKLQVLNINTIPVDNFPICWQAVLKSKTENKFVYVKYLAYLWGAY